MAALEIQAETARLAAEVSNRDGTELHLRVGLNSGQVISGEIGSTTASYTAIGEQVVVSLESVAMNYLSLLNVGNLLLDTEHR
jgi:class 3 adenylate cyclase